MTDLDTSEVIMNNVVRSPEESDFPKMHLALVNKESNDQLSVAFVNPYSKEEFFDDLQFVMQIEGPAEFTGGGTIGCEGNNRLSARLLESQAVVSIHIQDPSEEVKVWAGWATGQNYVRLTPELLLSPMGEEESQEGTEKDVDANVIKELESEIIKGEDMTKYMEKLKTKLVNQKVEKLKKKPKGEPKHGARIHDRKARNARRGDNQGQKEDDDDDNDDHDEMTRGKNKSFRQKYDSDAFASALDFRRHMMASVFLLLAIGYILVVSGRRRTVKGRRDL